MRVGNVTLRSSGLLVVWYGYFTTFILNLFYHSLTYEGSQHGNGGFTGFRVTREVSANERTRIILNCL